MISTLRLPYLSRVCEVGVKDEQNYEDIENYIKCRYNSFANSLCTYSFSNNKTI